MSKRTTAKAHRKGHNSQREVHQLKADHQSAIKAQLQVEKERAAVADKRADLLAEELEDALAERDQLRAELAAVRERLEGDLKAERVTVRHLQVALNRSRGGQ